MRREDNNYRPQPSPSQQSLATNLKLSIHSSTPSNTKQHRSRRNPSAGMGSSNVYSRSYQNSNSSTSKPSGLLPQPIGRILRLSRNNKPVQQIEFNNVKWISIISAYDSKRLKHVTISKQSCQAFLKKYGPGIKNDPMGNSEFKDMKRNFRCWLQKINDGYFMILDRFLSKGDRSPLMNLQAITPALQDIKFDTHMMQQKLSTCLSVYQTREFRQMYQRFHSYLEASLELQEIIGIIVQSKGKIEKLFGDLEREGMDRRVERIRKKGIKEVEGVVYRGQGNVAGFENRIIEKVSSAINEMANKSIDCFHKIQGVKQLLQRIQISISSSPSHPDLSSIVTLNKIFRQILSQSTLFTQFSTKFLQQGDMIHQDLRNCIKKYQDQVSGKRKVINELQVKFVGQVIGQAGEWLRLMFDVDSVIVRGKQQEQAFRHKYYSITRLLQEISQCLQDQTKQVLIQRMAKQSRSAFARLDDDLTKLTKLHHQSLDHLLLDTQDGYVQILQYTKLIKQYKQKVKILIKKMDDGMKGIGGDAKKRRSWRLPESDKEVEFLEGLAKLSEQVNLRQRKEIIENQPAFNPLPKNPNLINLSNEIIACQPLLKDLRNTSSKLKELLSFNPVIRIFPSISLSEVIYLSSEELLKMIELVKRVGQSNVVQIAMKISQIGKGKGKQIKGKWRWVFQRILCLLVKNGVKKQYLSLITDSQSIPFPQNPTQLSQHITSTKYLTVLLNAIGQSSLRPALYLPTQLSTSIKIMQDFTEAYKILQKVRKNELGRYMLSIQDISLYVSTLWQLCIRSKQVKQSKIHKLLTQMQAILKCKISYLQELSNEAQAEHHQSTLRIRNAILTYSAINSSLSSTVGTLSRLQPLVIYSKLVYSLCDYIHKTHQIAYFALNEWRQPIWIGEIKDVEKGIMARIGLEGMPKAISVDSWQKREGRINEKQIVESKIPTKAKINQQIFDQAQVNDQIEEEKQQKMDQDIADQEIEQNNEEIDEIEDIQEIAYEEPMEEQIEDVIGFEQDQEMGQDIEQQDTSYKKKDVKAKIEPKIQPKKIQEKKIEEKKSAKIQEVKLKVHTKCVYEMIPNIKSFSQIKSLMQLIASFEFRFWNEEINFTEIEAYFNQQENQLKDRTNFIQVQSKKLTKFIESVFQACFKNGIAQTTKVKQIFGMINSLAEKNWVNLFKILFKINRSYSFLTLKSQKNQKYLQIHISKATKQQSFSQQSIKCIQNYLLSNFKSQHFSLPNFQIKKYISNCLLYEQKQYKSTSNSAQSFLICKYTAQNSNCLPSQDTHGQIEGLIKVEKLFMDNKEDGIDLLELTYNLWMRAIQYQPEQRKYTPNFAKLDEFMRILSKVENDKWIGNYIQSVKSNSNNLKLSIKAHKNKIQGLLFRVSKQNILEIVKDLNKTYQPAIRKRIMIGESQIFLLQNEINCQDKLKSTYATAFDQLFHRIFLAKSSSLQVHLNQKQIIKEFSSQIASKSLTTPQFAFALNILRILKIAHHYSTDPQLYLKDTYQEVVLCFFNDCAHLNVQNIQEINLTSFETDAFEKVAHCDSSIQIQFNKKFEKSILSQQYNDQIQQNFAFMKKKNIQENEKLAHSIKEDSFYRLIWDNIFKIESKSEFNQTLHAVQLSLRGLLSQFDSKIKNTKTNLQMYIFKKEKEFLQFGQELQSELNSMDAVCKSSNSDLTDFQLYQKWISKIISKQNKICIAYKGKYDQSTIFLNLEVKDGKNAQKLKQQGQTFKNKFLSDYIFKNCKDNKQKLISKFTDQFMQNAITTTKTEIIFDLNTIANKILEATSHECLSITELYQFAQKFNINRYNTTKSIQNQLKKSHQSMIKKLQSREQLLHLFNQVKSNKQLQDIKQFPHLSELILQIDSAFNSHRYKLTNITQSIQLFQHLHPSQKDMMIFGDWFTNELVKKFKIPFYTIKSSQNSMITFIPVLSTEDQAKKHQINSRLSELNLPLDYFIEEVQGINVINLFQEEIICSISPPKNTLDSFNDQINQYQLNQFKHANFGIDPQFMWLLGIYQRDESEQTDNEYIPLAISQITLDEFKCNLTINQNSTSGTLLCYIAKIKREDYIKFANSYPEMDKIDLVVLGKKMIEVVSREEKVEKVVIGQRVSFGRINAWLKEQFNKEKKRKEDKEKEEIMLKRQKEEEEDKFLQRIYDQLALEEAVRIKVTAKIIQQHKSLKQIPQQQPQLTVRSKKIIQNTMKSIKKLQQNLSVQQLTSFQHISKQYIDILTQKLLQRQQIQQILRHNAQQKYKQSAIQYPSLQHPQPPQAQLNTEFILKDYKQKLKDILDKQAPQLQDKIKSRYHEFLSQLVNQSQQKDKDGYLEVIVDEFLKLSKSNKAKLILIDE